ncbi:hypothetical protein B0T24DRAFT_568127 [Lasiosphaeria ovina]|uniref:NAD-dependent epimerase/dehydratase domain-containing protein n=1 Tax=Lasiosphaeria ovina TaxID=92902 RepID=A0AAE0KLH0_9PEZI|nr:hypothetical protein B0T24DRAFT_568127 [Lasiosphaeria ovina]
MTHSFAPTKDLRIPRGSTILVTGVSGMIAVHIADEALKAGFRVRGTVRSAARGDEVAALLGSPAAFEYAVVPDMAGDAAFHVAMRGAAAAVHCASIHDFSARPVDMVPPTVRGSLNVLDAALAAGPDLRSVVFTSSTGAAASPRPGVQFHVGRDTWNDAALDLVRDTPPDRQAAMGFDWKMNVYRAAKVEAERAVWHFVERQKPPFDVNVVNPGMNFGGAKGSMGVSGAQVLGLLDGKIPPIPSLYMVDVVDDARIHVAAAIDATVKGQRIFACDSPFNWRLVIEAMHKALPDAQLPQPDPHELLDISTVDNALGAELLRKWWGQPGYKGLEQTVRETVGMCLARRNGEYKRRQPAQ